MTAKSTTKGVRTLGLRVDSRTSEKPDSPPEGTCSFRHACALHRAAQGTCNEADGKMLLVPQAIMNGLSLATDSFHVDRATAWALASKAYGHVYATFCICVVLPPPCTPGVERLLWELVAVLGGVAYLLQPAQQSTGR